MALGLARGAQGSRTLGRQETFRQDRAGFTGQAETCPSASHWVQAHPSLSWGSSESFLSWEVGGVSSADTGSRPASCALQSPALNPCYFNVYPDGSRCRGLRWRRCCRSPRSEPRSQESGGADMATVSKTARQPSSWGLQDKGTNWESKPLGLV